LSHVSHVCGAATCTLPHHRSVLLWEQSACGTHIKMAPMQES
jgi:hypothetical protein